MAVTCFVRSDNGCMFTRFGLHDFPRSIASFPALGLGYIFSRARSKFHSLIASLTSIIALVQLSSLHQSDYDHQRSTNVMITSTKIPRMFGCQQLSNFPVFTNYVSKPKKRHFLHMRSFNFYAAINGTSPFRGLESVLIRYI